MAAHNELGVKGEKIALEFLRKKVYKILAVNYCFEKCEIDIIAREDDTIVFVEVKTRTGSRYGFPEEAVGKAKQDKIAEGAEAFLIENNLHNEIRFDIISIIMQENGHRILHIKDAFAPGE